MAKLDMQLMFKVGGDHNEMDEAARAKVQSFVASRVGGYMCPDHGEPATVICSGSHIDNLAFEVTGCCQKMILKVKERLAS